MSVAEQKDHSFSVLPSSHWGERSYAHTRQASRLGGSVLLTLPGFGRQ